MVVNYSVTPTGGKFWWMNGVVLSGVDDGKYVGIHVHVGERGKVYTCLVVDIYMTRSDTCVVLLDNL